MSLFAFDACVNFCLLSPSVFFCFLLLKKVFVFLVSPVYYKIFGKNIGSSLLRNIFLTDKYKDTKEEMEQDVKAMGTSSTTANTNYIKTE